MVSHQGLQQPLYLGVKSDLLVMSKISQVKSLKSGGCGEQSYMRILVILSVASKCEHEKKTGSNKCQTCVLPLNIWSLTAVKANCCTKCKLFVCFWSAHFAHILFFFTFRHISRSETCTLASRNHRPKILAKNILLSKNKSSWQQPPTPNFECLVAKHWYLHPITTCFFLMCTRLGVTDSKRPCKLE